MKPVVKWVLGGVLAVVLLGAGVFVGPRLATMMSPFGVSSETVDTQVIHAIERTEEVSLLSLGIQGIEKRAESSKFFGMDVPGSERALFVQYHFKAKLGIDGKAVKIEPVGEKALKISIPAFTFIGYDDPQFEFIVEQNGVLSAVTPEIDRLEVANRVLNSDAQQKYIDSNDETLREQAEAFYTGIITGIDPAIDLEFEFASRPA